MNHQQLKEHQMMYGDQKEEVSNRIEMIDEDHHHNNKHHHHHQTEIPKWVAIGELWKRNVRIRKIENSFDRLLSNLFISFLNSPRSDNERPPQQRSGESSSGGAWRPRTAGPDEPRENVRTGPPPSENWGRSDNSSSWRSREKKRLNRFV